MPGNLKRVLFAAVIANILSGSSAGLAVGGEADAASEMSSQSLAGAGFGMSIDPVLSAIEELESDHDAKCHSSANRFEDFLFGTPLSEAARSANVELQVQLVRGLWARASRIAQQQGESAIQPHHVRPEIDKIVAVDRSVDGEWRVAFPDAPTLVIPEIRATQYASIAYSLRAILSVQQDFMVSGGAPLLDLEPESIDELREALDVVALSALVLADREARERSEYEIGESGLRGIWARLLPGLAGNLAKPDPVGRVEAPASAEGRARALALFDGIVERKTAAYRSYNNLDDRKGIRLLVFNISRFYARQPVSTIIDDRRRLVARLSEELSAFSSELLREADRRARAAGDPLIRSAEATAAVQQLIPNRIDEFEDVHVFGRLHDSERVTLEAFDCDSFRDFGTHWRSLQSATHAAPSDSILPDPFAAEVLAEGVSQYGVLLLRVAGVLARESGDTVRLEPTDLEAAARVIRDRASRHHAAPEIPETHNRIESASTPSGGGRENEEADARPFFLDVTAAAGVDFDHRSSTWLGEFRHKQLKTPPTFSGGGVAAEDVDGDSDIDLLFVGGGNALLLNDGHGAFTNATREAGIEWLRADGTHGEARQPIIADFDNDGRQDILITYANDDHRLYRNVGAARFEDVTHNSGLGGADLVGGPAAVFDFDSDGLLDVYIGYFGDYLHGKVPTFDRNNQNALPNRLFRNLGGLRFEDVTEGSGTADVGWTQAVSHVDFDRDGRQDIIVANDYGRNAFLRNLGSGKFENLAPALGVTKAFHSMNVGIADLNDDDYPDIYISNLAMLVKDNKYVFPDVNTPIDFDLHAMAGMLIKESDMFYMSNLDEQGRLASYAPSKDVERGSSSTGWAWDAEFFDFDHDGDDDLYLVNGTNDFNTFSMVYRPSHPETKPRELLLDHRRESNVFFLNEDGKLKNASLRSGADFAANSRSTAYLDYDDDGDLDIAVNNFHAPATFLRNDADKRGRGWLKIRLVGDPDRPSNPDAVCDKFADCGWKWFGAQVRRWLDPSKDRAPSWLLERFAVEPDRRSSRDAVGARIVVALEDGTRVRREVQAGSGYLSMNSKQQHFGVGDARSVDVQIIWPNGERQTLPALATNASYTVRQGVGVVEPAPPSEVTRLIP